MNLYFLVASFLLMDFVGGAEKKNDGKGTIKTSRRSALPETVENHSKLAALVAAIAFRTGSLDERLLRVYGSPVSVKSMKLMKKARKGAVGLLLDTLDSITLNKRPPKAPEELELIDMLLGYLKDSIVGTENIRAVVEMKMPKFFTETSKPSNLIDLLANPAAAASGLLRNISNAAEMDPTLLSQLSRKLSACVTMAEASLPENIARFEKSLRAVRQDGYLDTLNEAATATERFVSFHDDFAALGRELTDLSLAWKPFTQLSKCSGKENEMMAIVENLRTIGKDLDLIGTSGQSLTELRSGLKRKWVRDLINGGSELKKLSTDLTGMQRFAEKLQIFRRESEPIFARPDWQASHHRLYSLIGGIQLFNEAIRRLEGLEDFKTCLIIGTPRAPHSLKDLRMFRSKLESVSEDVSRVTRSLSDLKRKPDFEKSIRLIRTFSIEIGKVEKNETSFEKWKSGEDFKKVRSFLEPIKRALGNISVARAHNLEEIGYWGEKVEEVREWMRRTAVMNDSCSFSLFDGFRFANLSDFENLLRSIKTDGMIKDAKDAFRAAENSLKAFEQVKSLKVSMASSCPEALRMAFAPRVSLLADFVNGAHWLANLGRISKLKSAIDVVVASVPTNPSAEWKLKRFGIFKERVTKLMQNLKAMSTKKVENWVQMKKMFRKSAKAEWRRILVGDWMVVSSLFKSNSEASIALEEIGRALTVNLTDAEVSFGKMRTAIDGVRQGFFAYSDSHSSAEKGGFPALAVIGSIEAILVGLTLVAVFWIQRTEVPEAVVESPICECSEEAWQFNYVQVQDVRLEINRKDPLTGTTKLYDAVMSRDWDKMRDLIAKGALVDVPCGPDFRTALAEVASMKDVEHAKELLEKGAWPLQPDANGTFPDSGGEFSALFEAYGIQRRRVVPPNFRRSYCILILDTNMVDTRWRKLIPLQYRRKFTWGYRPGMNLDSFTHIVVPPNHVRNGKTLLLDDENLLLWKCVASLASLMDPKWLEGALRNIELLRHDENFMLTGMEYGGMIHPNSLLELKTDLHMGRPKFLTNVRVTILSTNHERQSAKLQEWQQIVCLFGGEVTSDPIPDSESTPPPYNTMYASYRACQERQNSCWILKFDDSKIDPIWRSDITKFTLAPFRFLPACISGFHILSVDNLIVPLDFNREKVTKTTEVVSKKR